MIRTPGRFAAATSDKSSSTHVVGRAELLREPLPWQAEVAGAKVNDLDGGVGRLVREQDVLGLRTQRVARHRDRRWVCHPLSPSALLLRPSTACSLTLRSLWMMFLLCA